MTDRRRHFANARVDYDADVTDGAGSVGSAMRVAVPVTDLCRAPDGPRDRQLVFGEAVQVLEVHKGWAFVGTRRDDPEWYVGYVAADALCNPSGTETHWITARSTHLYPEPNFKTPESASLSFGSRVQVLDRSGKFMQTPDGFLPQAHLRALNDLFQDPVEVAERFLGTPYLWGGNSGFGIDCSGLVQMACLACGIPCPGDSDMQEAELGDTLADDAPFFRGDLMFWKGHVAWVADDTQLLHANAHHMAVTFEPRDVAIKRIATQGDGQMTRRARLTEVRSD